MNKKPNKTIASAIISELNKGVEITKVTKSLAAYLIQERRIGDINAILRDIQKQIMLYESKLYVKTISVNELTKELNDSIQAIFKANSGAKEIIIENELNPFVIGGVRCETADQRLDLTVRRQLQHLKNKVVVT